MGTLYYGDNLDILRSGLKAGALARDMLKWNRECATR
jgi:hypothetical protein